MMKLRGTGKAFSMRVVVVIAIIAGLAVGYGLGYAQLQPQVEDLRASLANTEEELSVTQANLDKTQGLLLATKANLTIAEAELRSTLQELQSTEGELSTTQANLKSTTDQLQRLDLTLTQVKQILPKLEKDRLLLIELRRNPPETRVEARSYWNFVKQLAVSADPTLGSDVDRVITRIDPYFNWLEAAPAENATDVEFFNWAYYDYFYVYEAYLYSEAIELLKDAVLHMVIDHIDVALELIS